MFLNSPVHVTIPGMQLPLVMTWYCLSSRVLLVASSAALTSSLIRRRVKLTDNISIQFASLICLFVGTGDLPAAEHHPFHLPMMVRYLALLVGCLGSFYVLYRYEGRNSTIVAACSKALRNFRRQGDCVQNPLTLNCVLPTAWYHSLDSKCFASGR
jgi:hypothetical protein